MSSRLRRAIEVLVHLEDSPHRIALAFAIGVWIAFSPLLGIHTGLALAIAFLFRLSRGPILLGAYLNNPWTLAPMYMAGTLVGCLMCGVSVEGLAEIDWSLHGHAFYEALIDGLRPYLWPFILGNTTLGIVSAVAAYVTVRAVLERRRRRESASGTSGA
jgi:uncharacterized protein (DUF2062 family)